MIGAPRAILFSALALCAYCAVSALGGIALGFRAQQWYLLAFEVTVLLTAITTIVHLRSRKQTGQAMAMLVTGAVVGAGAVLSVPTIVAGIVQGGGGATLPIAGVNIIPWFLSRIGCAVLLMGLGGLAVLLRRPGASFGLLLKGVLLGLPVLACLGLLATGNGRQTVMNLPPAALIVVVVVGLFVICVLTSISGHCLIRAFEVGVEPESQASPKPAKA